MRKYRVVLIKETPAVCPRLGLPTANMEILYKQEIRAKNSSIAKAQATRIAKAKQLKLFSKLDAWLQGNKVTRSEHLHTRKSALNPRNYIRVVPLTRK